MRIETRYLLAFVPIAVAAAAAWMVFDHLDVWTLLHQWLELSEG